MFRVETKIFQKHIFCNTEIRLSKEEYLSKNLIANKNESMVSFVSRRYMRVVNGSLVVCLSEYLTLCSVYILVIKV